jgi:hypothetical protein
MVRHSGLEDRFAQVRERPETAALCPVVLGLRGQSKSPGARCWIADAGRMKRGFDERRHSSALTRIAGAHAVVVVMVVMAAMAEKKRDCLCEKPFWPVSPECRQHRTCSLHWPLCIAGMAAIRYIESFS